MFFPPYIAIQIVKRGCWRYMLYDTILGRDCNASIFNFLLDSTSSGKWAGKKGNSDVMKAIFRASAVI